MQPVVRFGSFELRSTERVLLSQGSTVPLSSRALDVLLALEARQGELVTKEAVLDTVWPGLMVEEAKVHVAVSQLRKALGKAAIGTVGGLGYRFVLPMHTDSPIAPGLPEPRTAFVGRQAELADAAAQLQGNRQLTLVAMGGMGETRLALQLAQALRGGGAAAPPGALPHAGAAGRKGHCQRRRRRTLGPVPGHRTRQPAVCAGLVPAARQRAEHPCRPRPPKAGVRAGGRKPKQSV